MPIIFQTSLARWRHGIGSPICSGIRSTARFLVFIQRIVRIAAAIQRLNKNVTPVKKSAQQPEVRPYTLTAFCRPTSVLLQKCKIKNVNVKTLVSHQCQLKSEVTHVTHGPSYNALRVFGDDTLYKFVFYLLICLLTSTE